MKKEKFLIFLEKYKWFLLIAIVIVASFYWLEYRPRQIVSWCTQDSIKKVQKLAEKSLIDPTEKDFTFAFNLCMGSNGLEK